MDFGLAISLMKKEKKVARRGWNHNGQFVYLVPAASYAPQTPVAKEHFNGQLVPYEPYFALKTVRDTVTTWVPSIGDCLADDWYEVSST